MHGQEEADVAGWAIHQIFALTFIHMAPQKLSYTSGPIRTRRIDKHQVLGIMLIICMEFKSRSVYLLYAYQSTVLRPFLSVSSKVKVVFSRF